MGVGAEPWSSKGAEEEEVEAAEGLAEAPEEESAALASVRGLRAREAEKVGRRLEKRGATGWTDLREQWWEEESTAPPPFAAGVSRGIIGKKVWFFWGFFFW